MVKRLQQGVVFIAFISLATISHAEESGQCKNWVAKAAAVVGTIDAKRHGQQDWQPVIRNNTYCPGDQIRAAKDSSATLVFTNETLVTLDQLTAITINKIDNDGPSILELVKGIAHFISRVPRSLKINTPFVNAAIEGTEFVVEVGETETNVTVFEGTVLTANEQGELRVTNNETSKSIAGQAPQKILMARPRDAVQWAVYFPPVTKGETDSDIKAQQSIAAIVNNQDNALALAQEAVSLAPDAAASHIALSYAWQSKFELTKAMASAITATEKEADNAIAWARLAELQLSVGELSRALTSAEKAKALDPSHARTHTILGYAYLTKIRITKARETFNKAIELDQSDPLPHLGLGLAMIRRNELTEGRREIEIAAALDPNNSIIRSYLGKAYFEEKRGPLDAEQFAMAKELDPNDPTPYFYDAIRKQTENDPVGALKDINKSIALNDNRAVFRSSLQLDQDEAVRNASLARIYQDLGFEQPAINEASKSLNQDPSSHSAHRFLADAYSNKPKYEIAHASELFQAQMLQPLGQILLQPQSIESDLDILNFSNSFGNSSSDVTNLFNRNGASASFNLFSGNQNTRGDELLISGLYNKFAISAAQFAYKNDGFRENNDVDHALYNLFVQGKLTNNLSIQAEYLNRSTDKGDLALRFDPTVFNPNERNEIDTEMGRVGFTQKFHANNTLLGSFINRNLLDKKEIINSIPGVFTQTITTLDDENANIAELQDTHVSNSYNIVSGLSVTDINHIKTVTTHTVVVTPPVDNTSIIPSNLDREHKSAYIYSNISASKNIKFDVGLSYDIYETTDQEINRLNPKIGAKIFFSDNTVLRLASLSALNKPIPGLQTLEPTQVSGFNQFYDDRNGTKIIQHGIGFEHNQDNKVIVGLESIYRDLESPLISGGSLLFDDLTELNHQLYLNWIINRTFSINASVFYEKFENVNTNDLLTLNKITTTEYPISFNIHSSPGINFKFVTTYVDQDLTDAANNEFHDSFWVADSILEYRFPRRFGRLSIGVNNLFDEQFNFYNINYQGETNNPKYIPARSILAQLIINLN